MKKKSLIKSGFRKAHIVWACIFFFNMNEQVVSAQAVLFDFNTAPLYSPFPINLTVGGITAHFSATGQGYSIQNANTMGFTPAGFDGRCIYPSSVFLADLLISFDQTLTNFSIMYACQELGCDDAATMRVTAKMNGTVVGTATKVASNPGTWPVDTLRCSFPQGFNSVVVHYDHRPPSCGDWGPIFLADNMLVTVLNVAATLNLKIFNEAFYIGNGQLTSVLFNRGMSADPTACDSITVQLRDPIQTNSVVAQVKALLHTDGIAQVSFPLSVLNHSYYIAVRHRNSMETWSKNAVLFNSSAISFDFTSP
jgi:hypothetical protein